MRASILCGALLLAASAPAQRNVSGSTNVPEQDCFDVKSYELRLALDVEHQAIDGSLRMRAHMLADSARIALDLDDELDVKAVIVAGHQAKHEHRELRVWVDLDPPAKKGEDVDVTVTYGGTPRVAPNPPWQGGFTWAKTPGGAPWIATTCQGEGADLWWPCKDQPDDEPDTMDLWIEVPKSLVVAANGTLASDETKGDRRTFHWHIANPINPYCVALNIAPYAIVKQTYTCIDGTKTPAWFFALPENEKKAAAMLPQFLAHLRQLEEVCGPYPFRNEKYGVVETPHLGMEHQTIIAYGNGFRGESDGYDWLHHHELSHEWWGNLVTNRDWKDMWIHEGIGTYMQALYLEKTRGREGYLAEMRAKRGGMMNRGPVAPREHRDSYQIYFTLSGNDIYNKGSWICHSLRWLLGDKVFFEVLRRWAYPDPAKEKVTDGSQCRTVDTDEFLAIAEKVSGRKLDWFFELYLRQPKLPRLDVEEKDGVLHLAWHTPSDLPFPMPVEVRIGDQVRRVEMPDGEAQVKVGSAKWQVDPDDWVLRENQAVAPGRRRR
ncbi:MAG: M1 family metallopeptidase [Planctomycetota bacterium]